ncbi:hypothetical protein M404DRAFT_876454 [Pisolithus tinctorius Marx 270]|uniref:Uncharacterized protein n=1 Tax=Pisolithus tinctorius Marx 270 TaxID=870435 RepID=A0A0C3KMG8_PISTI|nr:hypothetical protein M404DRAFT_876454 [Pisolithus tinctorius Marx 270]
MAYIRGRWHPTCLQDPAPRKTFTFIPSLSDHGTLSNSKTKAQAFDKTGEYSSPSICFASCPYVPSDSLVRLTFATHIQHHRISANRNLGGIGVHS